MITVELISSSGCKRCAETREELKAAAAEAARTDLKWRDVDVLDELDYAVSLGVLTLPALTINGKLVFTSLPTPHQLKSEIMKHMQG